MAHGYVIHASTACLGKREEIISNDYATVSDPLHWGLGCRNTIPAVATIGPYCGGITSLLRSGEGRRAHT